MKTIQELLRLAFGFIAVLLCASAVAGQPNMSHTKHNQGAIKHMTPMGALVAFEELLSLQQGQTQACFNPASRYSQIKFDPKYFEEAMLGNSSIAQTNSSATPLQGIQQQSTNLELQKQVSRTLFNLPIYFEGITDKTHYRARGIGYDLSIKGSEVLVNVHTANQDSNKPEQIRLRLLSPGAKQGTPIGEFEIPGKANYLVGRDQSKWKKDIPLYAKVRYRDVYEGIDRVFYGNQGELEYDWIVAPGADPQVIRERIEGADDVSIDANGDLVIESGSTTMRHRRPVAYQKIDGEQVPVQAEYVLAENGEIHFKVAEYDKSQTLIIDPVLSYLTFLGGGHVEPFAVATDSIGQLYVAGRIADLTQLQVGEFTTVNSFQATPAGGYADAFVLKLNSTGTNVIYATYIGGDGDEFARGLAVDSAGNAHITGSTSSLNYPTANAIQSTPLSYMAVIVTKLNSSGNGLVYSTLLTADGDKSQVNGHEDIGYGIAIDVTGNAYITGALSSQFRPTNGVSFPITPGAYSSTGFAFVTKLSPAGGMIYSTRLTGTDGANSIAIDNGGNAFVYGSTSSPNMPLVNPAQPTIGVPAFSSFPFVAYSPSTFVAKLNATGSGLIYSTYLGGDTSNGGTSFGNQTPVGIALDSSGHAWVTGYTSSDNFPLAPVASILFSKQPPFTNQGVTNVVTDTYVAKISPDGGSVESLVWLTSTHCAFDTLCGYPSTTKPLSIATDSQGNAYVSGTVDGLNGLTFPVVNAEPITGTVPSIGVTQSLKFLTKIQAGGKALVYSSVTQTGGALGPYIALSNSGDVYMAGAGTTDYLTATPGAYFAGTPSSFAFYGPYAAKISGIGNAAVVLTSSKNPASSGDSITLSASVLGNAPSGTVVFKEGGIPIGVAALGGNGVATIAVSPSLGTHSYTATYSGDSSNSPSDSLPFNQIVNEAPPPTGTVISASATGIPLSGAIQLTAYVTGSNSPSGTVLFKEGGTVIGSAALGAGQANLSLNGGVLAAGVHFIVAEYQGDAFNLASSSSPVSITVAAPPTIAVATPSQGSTILSTDPINYSFIATPNGLATISSVVVRVNNQIIATLTAPPYTISFPQAPPGSYTVDAIATDSYGQTTQSAPITYTVQLNGTVTTYLHQDLTGNTIAATDVNGNLLYTESYRPYGERLENTAQSQATQPVGNRIWFHGKVQDEATGLQYFGARYYDPVIGRFMGVDPVGFDEGNIHSFNRFAYGNNNPYRYRDPDGNAAVPLIIFGIGLFTFSEYSNAPGRTDTAQTTSTLEKASALVPGGNSPAGPLVKGMMKKNANKVDDVAKEVGKETSPKVKSVLDAIEENGFKVKVNPKNAATKQEGNVTIDFGDKTKVNLRVESHPLKQNGPSVRHGNVEVTKQVKNNNKVISNQHIVDK